MKHFFLVPSLFDDNFNLRLPTKENKINTNLPFYPFTYILLVSHTATFAIYLNIKNRTWNALLFLENDLILTFFYVIKVRDM